jgi:hypothetical protein
VESSLRGLCREGQRQMVKNMVFNLCAWLLAGLINDTSDRPTEIQQCHMMKALYYETEQPTVFIPYIHERAVGGG